MRVPNILNVLVSVGTYNYSRLYILNILAKL